MMKDVFILIGISIVIIIFAILMFFGYIYFLITELIPDAITRKINGSCQRDRNTNWEIF